MGWSPEQIAGRLARVHGRTIISHESIYRFVYHRTAQKNHGTACCRSATRPPR
jgi:transposase, IS30 family